MAVDEIAVGGIFGDPLLDVVDHDGKEFGVGIEDSIHIAHVTGAETRLQDLGWTVEPVAATDSSVVGDVPRRLFEIGHQTTPLKHLGEEVRGLFAS